MFVFVTTLHAYRRNLWAQTRVGILERWSAERWKRIRRKIETAGGAEDEGLVFKNAAGTLGWSRMRTAENFEQLKLKRKH